VDWRPQSGELLLFEAPELRGARVLVLAPHPDDAEIAAFGLYAGRESWVVTVTHGGYGGERYEGLTSGEAERAALQARLRAFDSFVVPRWGGVEPERIVNLAYPTTRLEAMRSHPARVLEDEDPAFAALRAWNRSPLLAGRTASPSWENLVGDLAALLAAIRPTIVAAPHPALDANRDHVATSAALFQALEAVGDPPLDLLLYTNHDVHSEYFPFGPAGSWVTLPPWFDAETPFRGVFSLPLSEREQLDKLFALEMHHDLRAPPERVLEGPVRTLLHRLTRRVDEVVTDPAQELSYYRRAVRPNELFLHYDSRDLAALRRVADGVLAGHR
jgi:LmbE family N-acetylglucosaminyl deacetylase